MLLAKPMHINSEARFEPLQPKEAQGQPHLAAFRYAHIRVEAGNATTSASKRECSTFADKPVYSRFQRKRRAKSRVKPLKNVLHFDMEAVGVGSHA